MRRYRHITDERKEYIEGITKKLRSEYPSSPGIDFNLLANGLDTVFLKTGKIGGSYAARISGTDYVVKAKGFISRAEAYETAHEFGHVVLHNLENKLSVTAEEDEADYFAEKLTGIGSSLKDRMLINLDASLRILRHPVKMFRYAFRIDKKEKEDLKISLASYEHS